MSGETRRVERDSLGDVEIPAGALYGAQTQRAVENFPVSGLRFPRPFLEALGLIKQAAAETNAGLGLLEPEIARAIAEAAAEVAAGAHDAHFPLDIFQTGSGTSTNMNANEVIARLASRGLGRPVHPNDHVNMGQSSNDVIPSALHASACLTVSRELLPALAHLERTLRDRAVELDDVVKTGRTHLMDALPLRLGQEIGAWAHQIALARERLQATLPHAAELAIGGTAIGSGLNAHPKFGRRVANWLAGRTGFPFVQARDLFAALAGQETAVELSGQLRALAAALMKITSDLRWMNSGPQAGLGEIVLPALQPGSSIMPGKVNPVIPEAVAMVCAQVMGNDLAVAIGGQSGSFQLNVMLPLIAHNLLQSIALLSRAARLLADKAIRGFEVRASRVTDLLERNPILVTALNRAIGYEQGAAIAKRAYAEGRPVKEVAAEMTGLSGEELARLLDPARMTGGGLEA